MPFSFLLVIIGISLFLGAGFSALLFYLFVRIPRKQVQSLEPSFADQFRQVIDQQFSPTLQTLHARLDRVQTFLGELHSTARGIDDVKHLLTHARQRGLSGEVSLQAILSDLFPANQLCFQARIIPGEDLIIDAAVRVLYDGHSPVWLPIDAKFPHHQTDPKALSSILKQNAKSIAAKYIHPPHTLDFAILFLPGENLFIDAVSIPGLLPQLYQDYRVYVAGPSTLPALIGSILLGIQTGALSHQAHHLTHMLRNCHTALSQINRNLHQSKQKLYQASAFLDKALTHTNALSQKMSHMDITAPYHDE